MNTDTGEIRYMDEDEIQKLRDRDKWVSLSEKEHGYLASVNQGLRPGILKKMRLRVPKK